ncbi:MAG: hypothetical protein KGN00_04940 [Chloroflexota bacterium]|nr:hypothetical protein [Chloroflexota bacterium]MDE3193014.1 hypothetical protein [Chloroflexota bacterium]
MLTPFAGAFAHGSEPEQAPVPEVVPIDELSVPAIEAAAKEIAGGQEEDEWPATA